MEAPAAWCADWFTMKWENKARVNLMLAAFMDEKLHTLPRPTFNYDLRAGFHGPNYSIRLAWRFVPGFAVPAGLPEDTRQLDVYIWLTGDAVNVVQWRIILRTQGAEIREARAPSLLMAEEELGLPRIHSLFAS